MFASHEGLRIERPVLETSPFPHALLARVLGEAEEAALLDWLEGDAPWRLAETDFYEQWEFSLMDERLPPAAAALVAPSPLAGLRRSLEDLFGTSLAPRATAVAHRLLPGQRIGIHNDHLPGEETHRLTVQLNRGLSDGDGGLFMLFGSFDPTDVHSVLRPVSGSAVAFEISERSHHAVSRVHGGERYTLVFSFFADDVA